jgi:16S rRNA processing protein RimM
MPAKKETQAGSPANGEPVFLAIGRLRSAHGVHGEITLEVWTEFPERIKPGISLYLGEDHLKVTVASVRSKDRLLLLSLKGYDQRESVNTLRNLIVYTKHSGFPKLPAGQYYHHELIGLKVVNQGGEDIGFITEILETGSNNVLIIDKQGKELLLPFIENVVISIEPSSGLMRVKLPQWE